MSLRKVHGEDKSRAKSCANPIDLGFSLGRSPTELLLKEKVFSLNPESGRLRALRLIISEILRKIYEETQKSTP